MEDVSPAEKQRREKYKDHDIVASDLKDVDCAAIRDQAISNIVHSKENDNVRLIVDAFMGFLARRGYRITKGEK